MKDFDYIIIGGGCAGLSLAYELDAKNKLKDKTLAIIETRSDYKRDKTWSFWKVMDHNFEDCVIKSWDNFSVNTETGHHEVKNKDYPYQTIDSGLFYEKILKQISLNKNIKFYKNTENLNIQNSIIFNSIPPKSNSELNLWQHFKGVEIKTEKNIFDDEIFNLMDFNCDQKNDVHFFYTLPFSKNKALIETTWLSDLEDQNLMDYDLQLENYIKNNLGIKSYKINFMEKGAIPLFYPSLNNDDKTINNREILKEGESFVVTLFKDLSNDQRRINVKKIVSLDNLINHSYKKVSIEIDDNLAKNMGAKDLKDLKSIIEIPS